MGFNTGGSKADLVDRINSTVNEVNNEPTLIKVNDPVEGPLSGEWQFDDLPGSIAAMNREEAIAKYRELKNKQPNYFNKV